LYEGEDKRFGVNVQNGVLQDIIRPLLPKTSFLARKYYLMMDQYKVKTKRIQSILEVNYAALQELWAIVKNNKIKI
jgi:hypothetical protein